VINLVDRLPQPGSRAAHTRLKVRGTV
jgi:hypothetical protein